MLVFAVENDYSSPLSYAKVSPGVGSGFKRFLSRKVGKLAHFFSPLRVSNANNGGCRISCCFTGVQIKCYWSWLGCVFFRIPATNFSHFSALSKN